MPGPSGCIREGSLPEASLDRIANLTLSHDPTCNLRCNSCRKTAKGHSPRSAHIQNILLDSGIFDHVDRLTSSGSGDPLASSLYWELLERLPAPRYPRLRLALQTNGLLLTPQNWMKLGEYAKRVDEVLVSVDACGPETYLINRGGSWDLLMRNLTEVRAREVPLQLSMVVQANNFREMPGFVRLANSLGARCAYFSALELWIDTYAPDDYQRRAVHLPGHPEHAELLNVLRDPVLQDPSRVTITGLPRPTWR